MVARVSMMIIAMAYRELRLSVKFSKFIVYILIIAAIKISSDVSKVERMKVFHIILRFNFIIAFLNLGTFQQHKERSTARMRIVKVIAKMNIGIKLLET